MESCRRLVSKVKKKCVVRWSKNKSQAGVSIGFEDKKLLGDEFFSEAEALNRVEITVGKKPAIFNAVSVGPQ